jgi:hypothetical protein
MCATTTPPGAAPMCVQPSSEAPAGAPPPGVAPHGPPRVHQCHPRPLSPRDERDAPDLGETKRELRERERERMRKP